MKDNGGQAYPTQVIEDHDRYGGGDKYKQDPGMTLRDWFAGQAIREATLGSEDILNTILGEKFNAEDSMKSELTKIAKWAYVLADAMLAERSKP
jgi:hypothetical protein